VEKYKDQTPPVKKGSSRLFRNLRDKGKIIQLFIWTNNRIKRTQSKTVPVILPDYNINENGLDIK